MLPEHGHIHISTPALFFIVLLIVAIIAGVVVYVNSKRKAKLDKILLDYQHEENMKNLNFPNLDGHYSSFPKTGTSGYTYKDNVNITSGPPPSPYPSTVLAQQSYPPGYVAPVYVNSGFGNSGFVEGMLIGELMSDRREDVYVHETPTHVDTTPSVDNSSWDSGITYDSGSSSSDSSYSSSSDSGGVDISW